MRILLISRHYPPAVSGGARRPFLLTQALRGSGAEVFVVAPSLPLGEPGLAIPHPHRDPSAATPTMPTWRDHARELLLWPDPDIRWSLQAAGAAIAAVPWAPDWIWTTSPPESVHAAGLRLKARFGARWLADFRDHWLERPHRAERAAAHRRLGERHIARHWLKRADLVTCVDQFVLRELSGLGAHAPQILPHFAPDIGETETISLPIEDINLVHTGSIALSDPAAKIGDLLAAFAAALSVNKNLRLHLVGRLTNEETRAISESAEQPRIVLHGVQSFERSLAFQRAADALVLVGSEKTRVPPSKLAEYLATDAPIIVCGAGSWRKDPRIDDSDPVAALVELRKGRRRARLNRAPSARQSAAQLLEALRRA